MNKAQTCAGCRHTEFLFPFQLNFGAAGYMSVELCWICRLQLVLFWSVQGTATC